MQNKEYLIQENPYLCENVDINVIIIHSFDVPR